MENTSTFISVVTKDIDSDIWHCKMKHLSEKGMKIFHSRGKLPGLKALDLEFCEDYVYGKQNKVSFTKGARAIKKERLELVHTDLWGPAQVSSIGGSCYFVTFIDDSTRKLWVYFLKYKSDVFETFKKWRVVVENEIGVNLSTSGQIMEVNIAARNLKIIVQRIGLGERK